MSSSDEDDYVGEEDPQDSDNEVKDDDEDMENVMEKIDWPGTTEKFTIGCFAVVQCQYVTDSTHPQRGISVSKVLTHNQKTKRHGFSSA